jgi:hypothetical protein
MSHLKAFVKRKESVSTRSSHLFVFGEAVGGTVNEAGVPIADVTSLDSCAAQRAARIGSWDSVVDENKPWSAPR